MFNNALIHAPSPGYVVAVEWCDGKVRLEMWDSSPRRPEVRPLDLDDEHGRGMRLIEALAEEWGSCVASGKCVWAVLSGTVHKKGGSL
jgi:two-component sensor histidine kinase